MVFCRPMRTHIMPEINSAPKKPTKATVEAFHSVADAATNVAQEAVHTAQSTTRTMDDAAKTMFPQVDLSRLEVPAAYRELAEKNLTQAKQGYDRVRLASEQANNMLETAFDVATKGVSEYTLRVVEAMRANTNAHFDYARNLLSVKSPSEAVELSTAHARKQFEAMNAQSKDLASLAQKLSSEAVEPLKDGMNKALRPVA